MVDFVDLADVLERVLTKGIVIETDASPEDGSEVDNKRAASPPSFPIMGLLKVLKVTDD